MSEYKEVRHAEAWAYYKAALLAAITGAACDGKWASERDTVFLAARAIAIAAAVTEAAYGKGW
jgi:hypothetical protein